MRQRTATKLTLWQCSLNCGGNVVLIQLDQLLGNVLPPKVTAIMVKEASGHMKTCDHGLVHATDCESGVDVGF